MPIAVDCDRVELTSVGNEVAAVLSFVMNYMYFMHNSEGYNTSTCLSVSYKHDLMVKKLYDSDWMAGVLTTNQNMHLSNNCINPFIIF